MPRAADTTCKVDRLQDIFKINFGFTTETYEIPSERSETGLCRSISDFAYRYDSPNKLGIIYYGGHGEFVEGKLRWFAYVSKISLIVLLSDHDLGNTKETVTGT